MNDFEEKLNELFDLTKTSKISELSKKLEVSPVTIRSWRKREKIPEDAFRKAKNSGDQVNNRNKLSENELKNYLMEGLFRAVQLKGIYLANDVGIGSIADILVKEIKKNKESIFIHKNEKAS